MRYFQDSELILNPDGSVFHLHLLPEDIADDIILVGDPDRVDLVASFFSSVELRKCNREFRTITGDYKGKRMTVVSTGIGTDNIDIVVNELDALVSIDLVNRCERIEKRTLRMVRIGTSGSLQKDIPVDSYLLSEKSVGFDGLLNFYAGRNEVSDPDFESALKQALDWHPQWASPYVVSASKSLVDRLLFEGVEKGITISAPGFYGPQGRQLRLALADPRINEKLRHFRYKGFRLANYEMESSAIAGLAALLGHEAVTICAIIANREAGTYSEDYKLVVEKLIENVLESLCSKDF